MKPRVAALLLSLVVVLGACTPAPDERPRPTANTPTKPYFADQHLRPVRMATGRALGYVQRETGSQILCQLLDKEAWERLLDGKIGRKPLSPPYSGCHIATERGLVAMQLLARDAPLTPDSTVAGRPSAMVRSETGTETTFTVALADDALTPAPRQDYPVRRLLELKVIDGSADEQRDTGTRVIEEIVPLLTKEGEPLPEIDTQGRVRLTGTPVDADQFVDLPTPVQALALCMVVQQQVSGATDVEASDTGSCRGNTGQGTVVVEARQVSTPAEYPDRVAGRPARLLLDPPVATVLLHDGAGVELYVSAPDAVALAEKIVPLLVD